MRGSTLTFTPCHEFIQRGDYIMLSQRKYRVTARRGGVTLVIRPYAGWLEPINRRIEDWLLFPISDVLHWIVR